MRLVLVDPGWARTTPPLRLALRRGPVTWGSRPPNTAISALGVAQAHRVCLGGRRHRPYRAESSAEVSAGIRRTISDGRGCRRGRMAILAKHRATSTTRSIPTSARNDSSPLASEYWTMLYATARPTCRWRPELSGCQESVRGLNSCVGVSSRPSLPPGHGNSAPSRPAARAAARATPSLRWR
jgi:hypothetical protein